MPIAPINACFDVTRSDFPALATHDEVCSEVAQASGDDETDPAYPHRHRPAADYGRPIKEIRNTWNSATTPKITLAIIVKVFWLMAQCPRRYSTQLGSGVARPCPLSG